jgi:RHS repeat-associated protein
VATYTYNGRKTLKACRCFGQERSDVGRSPEAPWGGAESNQIASTVVENGLFTATRSYDPAGRLTGITHSRSVGVPPTSTTTYTLSPDGRRTGITRNGNGETYGYDNARQVTSASFPDLSASNSYAYDNAGNRSSATTNGTTTTYLANLVNEYTTITGTPAPPLYDDNGNAIAYPVRPLGSSSLASCVFTWDINNQLISATVGTDTATYQYDALGRRTKRIETIAGNTTHTCFFTNGWNVELEHNGTDYTTRLTWGLDLSNNMQGAGGVGGLVMVENLITNNPFFPCYDGNGNITAWVDENGTVTARQRYDAFGNIIEQIGTAPSNYGFSTKPIEKVTGFHYYGYRYYDAVSGRWPSRDPIEEEGGINLYAFVENDGVNMQDLLGLRNSCTDEDGNVDEGCCVEKCLEACGTNSGCYCPCVETCNSGGVPTGLGAGFLPTPLISPPPVGPTANRVVDAFGRVIEFVVSLF